MSARGESFTTADPEKRDQSDPIEQADMGGLANGRQFSGQGDDVAIAQGDQGQLKRGLKGRHMQMIAM